MVGRSVCTPIHTVGQEHSRSDVIQEVLLTGFGLYTLGISDIILSLDVRALCQFYGSTQFGSLLSDVLKILADARHGLLSSIDGSLQPGLATNLVAGEQCLCLVDDSLQLSLFSIESALSGGEPCQLINLDGVPVSTGLFLTKTYLEVATGDLNLELTLAILVS